MSIWLKEKTASVQYVKFGFQKDVIITFFPILRTLSIILGNGLKLRHK